MNWLLIAVMMIFLICIVVGAVRGAIKITVSLVTTLLTFLIVSFATPFVAKAIAEFTPLDDVIETQISNTITDAVTAQILGVNEEGLSEEGVRKALRAAGVDENTLADYGITIEDIVEGRVSKSELAQYGISGNVLDGVRAGQHETQEALDETEIPRDVQTEVIKKADIPDIYKKLLNENNNSEIYRQLGVETFAQYVGSYLAKLLINIVSFLCTFLLVTIVFRAIVFALDIVAELPGIGAVNHLVGGIMGILGALVIVWLLYLIITLFFTTAVGKLLFEMIQDNAFLKVLYEYNPVMKLATIFK
ncbi:MAG: CvpA family protein [Dorea sp.]|jgi:uncharacterized membrane protein required for colicin V production|nr:CvpA family protein [Dorea sp.]MCI9226738.1 CvpA family protein [Dorea sp.]